MHVEFLVEDDSTAASVNVIIDRLLSGGQGHSRHIRSFGGKQRMLRDLGGHMQALRWADAVVVVIDQDRDDCIDLKRRIEDIARASRLLTSAAEADRRLFRVRIAMHELETWFLGDPIAIRAAYPRVQPIRISQAPALDEEPDAWERLERILQRGGYYEAGLQKISVAEAISQHLDLSPDANASHSFRLFLRTLRETYGLD